MILPLLSYVTEQLTAGTSTKNRYGNCLSLCANQVVNFVVENFFTLCESAIDNSLFTSLSLNPKTLISQNPSFSPCFKWRLLASQLEPSPGFEERLDDFAEKVADIDVDLGEGPETLVENVQTTPMHPPRRLFQRGRFLLSRFPNRALLRMNLKTPAPKRQRRPHPPLQN